MSAWALALAAITLLVVIGMMNYLYPPLRNETISAGLSGPYHWWLDASYLLLAVALVWRADGHPWSEALAWFTGLALIGTAVTNSFSMWVDRLSQGQHSLWHSRFTTATFTGALLFELVGENGGTLWAVTALNILVPTFLYFETRRSDYAEKCAVALIVVWLVLWSLT